MASETLVLWKRTDCSSKIYMKRVLVWVSIFSANKKHEGICRTRELCALKTQLLIGDGNVDAVKQLPCGSNVKKIISWLEPSQKGGGASSQRVLLQSNGDVSNQVKYNEED